MRWKVNKNHAKKTNAIRFYGKMPEVAWKWWQNEIENALQCGKLVHKQKFAYQQRHTLHVHFTYNAHCIHKSYILVDLITRNSLVRNPSIGSVWLVSCWLFQMNSCTFFSELNMKCKHYRCHRRLKTNIKIPDNPSVIYYLANWIYNDYMFGTLHIVLTLLLMITAIEWIPQHLIYALVKCT